MHKFQLHAICLIFILFCVLTISCKKEKGEEEPIPEATPVVPSTDTCGTLLMSFLSNGHQLVYDFTYFGTTIPLTHTIKSYGSKGEFKTILSSALINDSVYSKECNGWLYRSPRYPLLNTYKFRKSATALNDAWTYTDAAVTENYLVVAKNISVTVSAGTFICDKITYKKNGTSTTDTIYFNNQVGDVKYINAGFEYKLKSKNF